jgi:hypothetical protein
MMNFCALLFVLVGVGYILLGFNFMGWWEKPMKQEDWVTRLRREPKMRIFHPALERYILHSEHMARHGVVDGICRTFVSTNPTIP